MLISNESSFDGAVYAILCVLLSLNRGTDSGINSLCTQDFYFGIGSDIVLTRKLGWPFANDVSVNPGFFGTLQVSSSPFLLTCGHWDNSFKVVSLENGDMIQSIYQHKDIITCLSGKQAESCPRGR